MYPSGSESQVGLTIGVDVGDKFSQICVIDADGEILEEHVFYQSAFASLKTPASRAFYDRKRSEGKRHHQALLALARRRINVLSAMLRDGILFDQQVGITEIAVA